MIEDPPDSQAPPPVEDGTLRYGPSRFMEHLTDGLIILAGITTIAAMWAWIITRA